MKNELRERVVVRVDGGIRSGRDVLVGAALGGDEFGFGTVAMIATGCIMARVCHTNNCPVGVASQREELRARFPGAPADLVNFFHFIAEEVGGGGGVASPAVGGVRGTWWCRGRCVCVWGGDKKVLDSSELPLNPEAI